MDTQTVQNKYFTPSIEDIRVGYEYEYDTKSSLGWIKCVVADYHFNHTIPEGYTGVSTFNASEHLRQNNWIRVPYLTKEQVRDDGWKVITPSSDRVKEGIFFFEKGNYFLITDFSRNVPFLDFILRDPSIEERVHNPERFRFFCNCKSINEFRYITKLLGI